MFCAGVFFPRSVSLWLPFVVMLATDLGLNIYYQHSNPANDVWSASNLANLSFNYVAYFILILLGRRFRPTSALPKIISGGIFGAILFYLITNTASWLFNPFHNPEYTKTIAGWLIALTKGVGGYPSTLEFFRNTLLSGGIFTALFAATAKFSPAESPAEKHAGQTAPAAETEPLTEPEEAQA